MDPRSQFIGLTVRLNNHNTHSIQIVVNRVEFLAIMQGAKQYSSTVLAVRLPGCGVPSLYEEEETFS